MDPDLGRFPVVWAAAGTPNAVFAVPPGTLRSLANATVAPIAETAERSRTDIRARSVLEPTAPRPGRERGPGRHWARRRTRSRPGSRRRVGPWSSTRAVSPRGIAGPAVAAWPRITAMSEVGGTLTDHGSLVSADPDRLCRAELRVEGPLGALDGAVRVGHQRRTRPACCGTPRGCCSCATASGSTPSRAAPATCAGAATAARPWSRSLGSSRLDHVIVQSEIETVALDGAGSVVWRLAHCGGHHERRAGGWPADPDRVGRWDADHRPGDAGGRPGA